MVFKAGLVGRFNSLLNDMASLKYVGFALLCMSHEYHQLFDDKFDICTSS